MSRINNLTTDDMSHLAGTGRFFGTLGLDYTHCGVRRSCFQLCTVLASGRIEAHAYIEYIGDVVQRVLCTAALECHKDAIMRLGRIHRSAAIPAAF